MILPECGIKSPKLSQNKTSLYVIWSCQVIIRVSEGWLIYTWRYVYGSENSVSFGNQFSSYVTTYTIKSH